VSPTLARFRIGRRRRPGCLIADKGYDSRAIRAWCRQRQIRVHIPERAFYGRRRRRGRPVLVDRALVAQRWVIERTFAWLNNSFRRLRIRYERRAQCYEALCILGCCLICLQRVLR
jgi:transposase